MKPMLAENYSDYKEYVQFPIYAQPKYDGVRCIITKDCEILSRNGKVYNIPHLKAWAENNKSILPLDGELYSQTLTFEEILSAVKKQSALTDEIKYYIYDKPNENLKFSERLELINKIPNSNEVQVSQTVIIKSEKGICDYHTHCVVNGYEGIMLRKNTTYKHKRTSDLLKYKHFDNTEYVITDIIQAAGKDSETAILVLKTKNGTIFNAKPAGSFKLRKQMLIDKNSLVGKLATIKHFGFTTKDIPRFPVALCIRDYE